MLGTKCVGQHLVHRLDALGGHKLHGRSPELVEQLPAAAARHQHVAGGVHAVEGPQLPAAGHLQVPHQGAFGAQCQPVAGVLHVAAADQPAVGGEGRCPHRELRIRGIGFFHGARCLRPEQIPVDDARFHRRHPLTYGMPLAAGGRDRPTSPATASTVTR